MAVSDFPPSRTDRVMVLLALAWIFGSRILSVVHHSISCNYYIRDPLHFFSRTYRTCRLLVFSRSRNVNDGLVNLEVLQVSTPEGPPVFLAVSEGGVHVWHRKLSGPLGPCSVVAKNIALVGPSRSVRDSGPVWFYRKI